MELKHYTAKEGYFFRRISDKKIFGNEIDLGYTSYINDVRLPQPHLETIDEYEEINQEILDEEKSNQKDELKIKISEMTNELVYTKYSKEDVEMIISQKEINPEIFEEYNNFYNECEAKVKEELNFDLGDSDL